MIIYKITNKVNAKTYIGKTSKSAEERLQRHFYSSKNPNTYLHKAIKKHGREAFTIEIIEQTSENMLDEREKYWINILAPEYNMTVGGEGGDTSNSPNYKEGMKRRNFFGENNPMYGRKRTDTIVYLEKARDKMIAANKCAVSCEGNIYDSIGEAQNAYPGISIRKRIDNDKYPEFFRLREKTYR